MTMTTLDEIQARADAATEGPWRLGGPGIIGGVEYVTSNVRTDADAEFIAHAREDVPKLVAALRAVEAIKPWSGDYPPYDSGYNTALQDVQAAIREALG